MTRRWAGLAGTVLLVLQAAVTGWVLGAGPAPQPAGAFPALALCSPWTDGTTGQDGGGGPHHLPPCCTAGCVMLGGYLAPPFPAPQRPPQGAAVALDSAGDTTLGPTRPRFNPHAPRGPPAA